MTDKRRTSRAWAALAGISLARWSQAGTNRGGLQGGTRVVGSDVSTCPQGGTADDTWEPRHTHPDARGQGSVPIACIVQPGATGRRRERLVSVATIDRCTACARMGSRRCHPAMAARTAAGMRRPGIREAARTMPFVDERG